MNRLASLAQFGRTHSQAEEEPMIWPARGSERIQQGTSEITAALLEHRPINIFTGELSLKQRSKQKQNEAARLCHLCYAGIFHHKFTLRLMVS